MISKVINGTEQNVAGNGGGGTNDYEELINLPQINGNELTGDQTGADLGLVDAEEGKGLSTNDYDNTEKEQNTANASAIEAIVNVYGGKNLLQISATSGTVDNVQYTVNSDGSISASGLANGSAVKIIAIFSLPIGIYKINGCGDIQHLYCTLRNNADDSYIANLTDDDYILTVNNSSFVYKIQMQTVSGINVNDTLYPMLRDARISDTTFAPYAMTNRELTENKVSKSGDTMTGDLAIDKASADLAIRASGSKFSHIKSSATDGDRTNYLPNKDGTFAMTSDVDNKVGNYVQLPFVHYRDLPSQSTVDETYFRELITYYNTNGFLNFSDPTHVQAICCPNLQGILEGFIYNGNTALQYSWWCATIGQGQILFGYNNSNWYFYNVKGAISQRQVMNLNDTVTINNLEYDKAYLVTWIPQYTSNSNGAWIVLLGRQQQHVIKFSEFNVSLSYTLTSITLTYLSSNRDVGTLTVTPI